MSTKPRMREFSRRDAARAIRALRYGMTGPARRTVAFAIKREIEFFTESGTGRRLHLAMRAASVY